MTKLLRQWFLVATAAVFLFALMVAWFSSLVLRQNESVQKELPGTLHAPGPSRHPVESQPSAKRLRILEKQYEKGVQGGSFDSLSSGESTGRRKPNRSGVSPLPPFWRLLIVNSVSIVLLLGLAIAVILRAIRFVEFRELKPK
jgi:hypothetical protein